MLDEVVEDAVLVLVDNVDVYGVVEVLEIVEVVLVIKLVEVLELVVVLDSVTEVNLTKGPLSSRLVDKFTGSCFEFFSLNKNEIGFNVVNIFEILDVSLSLNFTSSSSLLSWPKLDDVVIILPDNLFELAVISVLFDIVTDSYNVSLIVEFFKSNNISIRLKLILRFKFFPCVIFLNVSIYFFNKLDD
jgi:hypothetical protein